MIFECLSSNDWGNFGFHYYDTVFCNNIFIQTLGYLHKEVISLESNVKTPPPPLAPNVKLDILIIEELTMEAPNITLSS
jgi:hypothetical protein